ncbi:MAG TPA: hypothetical protein VHD58_01115 [Mycobacteriales bacterium]|nr:hypothetical protein [Mycobacteriales bacterium]
MVEPDVPEALSLPGKPIRDDAESESDALWTGPVTLELEDSSTVTGTADLRWAWVSAPELRCTVQTNEQLSSNPPFGIAKVSASDLALTSPTAIRLKGLVGLTRVAVVGSATIGNDDADIDELILQLVNVPRFLGLPVRSGQTTWAGRIEFEVGEWIVRVDGRTGVPEDRDEQRQAGYLVTHVGRVIRADGSTFTLADVEPVVAALASVFSLLRGAYSSPLAWHGRRTEKTVWARHTTWPVDSWQGQWGPFPVAFVAAHDTEVLPALARAVCNWMQLATDPDIKQALDRALLWLLTANTGGTPGDIILVQAGLELLSYLRFVVPGSISPRGFEEIPAADQIRLLMRNLRLPVDIPMHYAELSRWAAKQQPTPLATPELIARFRNLVVHPPTRRRPAGAFAAPVQMQARELALSVLEKSLLLILGYDGPIADRSAGFTVTSLAATLVG